MQGNQKRLEQPYKQETNAIEAAKEAKQCAYDKAGICILSDCPCQMTVAGGMMCSSFQKKTFPKR